MKINSEPFSVDLPHRGTRRRHLSGGYSLAELMAAAAVFSIVVLGVVTLITKGRNLDITDGHRRVARLIVDASLEDTDFGSQSYESLASGTLIDTVVIDTPGGNTLPGRREITVGTPQTFSGVPSGSNSFPYYPVTVRVTWNEPDMTVPETVQVVKWISQARW
jgi:hypothetical protein